MTKNKAIVLTIISALLYGFTPVICSLTYKLGNNSFSMTFFRSFFVIPILGALMIKNRVSFKLSKDECVKIFIVGMFGAVLTTLLLYSSYNYIGVGTTTTLHFLYPLFVLVLCRFIYKDKITRNQLTSLVLGMVGVTFFIDANDFSKLQGIVMALLSGITFAIYLVGIEKLNLAKMNNYKLSFYFAVVVVLSLLFLNIFTNKLIFVQTPLSYILMASVGILASFLALIFLKIGIEILGSSLASMFCLFEPISSVFFGFIFLSEQIDLFMIIGCIIIMISMGLLVKKQNKK